METATGTSGGRFHSFFTLNLTLFKIKSPVMKAVEKMISCILLACGFSISASSAQEAIPWCFPDTITKTSTANTGGIYLYTFDDRGNALVTEYLDTDRNGIQVPSQKIISTYNRFDLVDTSISYTWINGEYIAMARKISSYDARGNHIFLLNENNNGTDGWAPASRYTYTYNEHNLKTGALVETFANGNSGQWVYSEKADYTYDEKDRETSYEHYVWTGTEWTHFRSTFNKYENDLLVQESGKGMDAEGIFTDLWQISYTYNTQGKATRWLYLVYEDGAWINAYRRDFSYDDKGYDTAYISYEWNLFQTEEWDATVREHYTNRADGQREKVEHYTTIASTTDWILSVTLEYEYNESGRRTAFTRSDYRDDGEIIRYEFTLNENNDDIRAACYVKKGEDWIPTDQYNLEVQYHDGTEILYANSPAMHEIKVHYKSGVKTPLPDAANERRQEAPAFSIRIWPNPAREILHVEADEDGYFDIALFDMSGRKVESRRAVQRADFNVERHHGLYVLRVEKNGVVISRKVMIL